MNAADGWSTFTLFIGVVFKLGLVLLLIYSSVIILHRLQANQNPQFKKHIRIIETSHLSPHRSLHLIQLGSQIYLIGATDHEINLLSTVEDQEVLSSVTSKASNNAVNPLGLLSFANIFLENLKKHKSTL
ncbi:MAG: FliO/MopB family protein [Anaerolineales bacterium]